MKIYVQVIDGPAFELEVNNHTSIEKARDLLIDNYKSDFEGNIPSSNNSLIIEYNFVHNGKYLFDPDPFSTLKENARVILYIRKKKPRGLYALEIGEESENENENENENEEEENQDVDFNHILNQRPDLAHVLQRLRPAITRAAEISLVSQAYNDRNNFWDQPADLAPVENILQEEDSQAAHLIASSFLETHFHQLFRYNDINIGTVLNIMGGGPLITFGNEQNLNENNDGVNDNDNNSYNNNSNNNNSDNNDDNNNNPDYQEQLYNNRIYADYNNTNIILDLDILLMEMSTNQQTDYNKMLDLIEKSPELKRIRNQRGILEITQIFKENNYDISKTIDSIKQPSPDHTNKNE